MFMVENLHDLWNLLDLGRLFKPLLSPVPMLVTGLLMCSYASALIIITGIGIRIMDLRVITMTRKWGWSFLVENSCWKSCSAGPAGCSAAPSASPPLLSFFLSGR